MQSKKFLTKKLTAHARHSIVRASKIASACGENTITPAFLFFAIFLEKSSVGSIILKNMHLKKSDFERVLFSEPPNASHSVTDLPLHKTLSEILTSAYASAADFHYPYVGTEHLIYALLEKPTSQIKTILTSAQKRLTTSHRERTKKHDEKLSSFASIADDENPPMHTPPNALAHIGQLLGLDHTQGASSTSRDNALAQFTTDLAGIAYPHPFIGHDETLLRISTILGRKNKNNPLIVGEPGVGKTALVEHLAHVCQADDAPAHLHGKHILTLDLTLLIAGTSFRGEFEQRLKDIITEAEERDDIILFIDEFHTIIGTGNTGGSLDAANILKPALARGKLTLIGATTFEEYKKHIEKDAALARRFQKVILPEPTTEQTIKILRGVAPAYAAHYNIRIPHELLTHIATLTTQYIPEQHLPDKALDVLDETAARITSTQHVSPEITAMRSLERTRATLHEQKERALTERDFNHAIEIQEKETAIKKRIAQQQKMINADAKNEKITITPQDIAQTIHLISGTPADAILARPTETIARAEKIMRKHIIGQNHIIHTIAQTLLRNSTGLKSPTRPQGSFLFFGPTGVGKTYTATTLARKIFGSDEALIRIDMSEYMERHHSAKLLGAPAGYVGYGEGGTLTEQVRRRPHSVVLFDEIEKAHPDVFHLLLQILEDGRLTDSEGRVADFSHSIVIMTTNAGSEEMQTLGFHGTTSPQDPTIPPAIKNLLPPEIHSRIDHLCAFASLTQKTLERIARIELSRIKKQLKKQKIILTISPTVPKAIAQQAHKQPGNARAIRATMQELIEAPLANHILQHPDQKACTITLTDRNKITVH